ncbi:MAG TPA: hypothetical protein EYG92_12450 [Lutibacter sp.]|nr:hypothetical protein [Lutibacter sp.]
MKRELYTKMKKTKKLKFSIENAILIVSVFLLSLLISPYYTDGDQFIYRVVYEGLQGLNLKDGYAFYIFHLDSKEVIHFLLSWLATNQEIDKDLFMAFSNAVLAFAAVGLMRKLNVSVWIMALLLLTNFYFYVLYFAAERLKFGFIFLFFSLLYMKRFYIFTLLSIFSHVQVIILYGSILFKVLFRQTVNLIIKLFSKGKIKKKSLIIISLLPIILFLIYFALSGHLESKFQYYYEKAGHSLADLVRIFAFFILTLWYAKNKEEVVLIFIPLVFSVYLIGGERINMMAYFVFLYYALPIRKGFNIGVLITSSYFLFLTYGFMVKIIEHGDGFYGY